MADTGICAVHLFCNIHNQQVAQKFLREHPGEVITRYRMVEIVCDAYNQSFLPATIIHSFKAAGIMPYNPSVLSEIDFAPSKIPQVKKQSTLVLCFDWACVNKDI